MKGFSEEWLKSYTARKGPSVLSKDSKKAPLSSIEREEIGPHDKSQGDLRASKEVWHKFGAQKKKVDGIKFPSELEADYYATLKMLQKLEVVLFFLRQVPLHLTGGSKLIVDFLVFWSDGRVTFEDTKGVQTPVYKLKKREVEALYPIEVKTVTRKMVDQVLNQLAP